MPFLGSTPADQYQSLAKQTITGDGSTAYTLNRSVTNAYDMEVFINNVRQEPDTSYTASGNTITFTAAVTASDSCYLIYQGQSVGSINPPAGSVGGTQIQNTSVTNAHLAGSITDAKLHSSLDLSSKTLSMPAGHVIQVVQGVYTANGSITSSTLTDTGISQSITPKNSSSKVLVLINALLGLSGTNGGEVYTQIVRDSTPIRLYERALVLYVASGGGNHTGGSYSYCFLDSPSTTSATTYKLQGRTNSGTLRINDYYSGNNQGACTITLMEIAQ